MRRWITIFILLGLTLNLSATPNTISYQGQLQDASGPVTDTHDMAFRLFDSETGAGQIGSTVNFAAVPVQDGLFQVELDFGIDAFSQGPRYLEVEVAGAVLEPRQLIRPAPTALNVLNLPDIDDTLAQLNCAPGEIAQFDGSEWSCAAIEDSDTLAELGCATGEVAKWGGSSWACASDEDTLFSAGVGLELTGTTFALDTGFSDGRYWTLGGNSGINSSSDVLGTTDFRALEVHVDGRRAFRFQPTSFGNQEPNLVGGHESNAVLGNSTRGATIAGGGESFNDRANIIAIGGNWGFIGGGSSNRVEASYGTVSGGSWNWALGSHAFVGGGTSNEVSGMFSVIGGGFQNEVSGERAVVPGGGSNLAAGDFSFAAGISARALHRGAFVWSDPDRGFFGSTDENQFLIGASGGVGINTNSPLATLDVEGDTRLGGTVAIDFSDENDMPPQDGFDLPTLYTLGSSDVESLYFGTGNSAEPIFRASSVRSLLVSRNFFTLARPLEGSSTGQAAELRVEGFAEIENTVSVGGNVEVGENLVFFDGTPQRTAGPIAKAYINSDGSIANGVNIESVEWEAGSSRYRVTVAGENYWFNRYVATITPSGSTPTAVSTASQGGDLIVYFEGGVQQSFQLVVHDLPDGAVIQATLADSSELEVRPPRGPGTDQDDDTAANP